MVLQLFLPRVTEGGGWGGGGMLNRAIKDYKIIFLVKLTMHAIKCRGQEREETQNIQYHSEPDLSSLCFSSSTGSTSDFIS
jgi:hypothetical protein